MREASEEGSKTVKGKNVLFLNFGKPIFNCNYFLPRFCLFTFAFLLLPFAFCVNTFAQTEQSEDTDYPPPLKIISKPEKSLLDADTTDVSSRTKLSLDLMENRLKKAEDFFAKQSYAETLDQLGGFNALMDDTLDFLNKNDNGRNKVLNNYKRLEITLRKFVPRIELIRRDLPTKYEFYVRNLIKNVREARSKAVEPLFGDSVVPNNRKGN